MKARIIIVLLSVIAIIVISLTSCKTRQLSKERVKTETKTESQVTAKNTSKFTDTTKMQMITLTETQTDNDYTAEIEGDNLTVSKEGLISGGKKIRVTGKTKTNVKSDNKENIQKGIAKTDSLIVSSNSKISLKTDSLKKEVKSDSTLGANLPWWVWLTAILAVMVGSVFVYSKIWNRA